MNKLVILFFVVCLVIAGNNRLFLFVKIIFCFFEAVTEVSAQYGGGYGRRGYGGRGYGNRGFGGRGGYGGRYGGRYGGYGR